MSERSPLLRYWPRRADGLPPGQRLAPAMPRFSDSPKRWAPAAPDRPTLTISHDGVDHVLDLDDLERFGAVDTSADFHCVTTWSVQGLRWRGVRLREVVDHVLGTLSPSPFARAVAADRAAARFVTEDLLADDVLVATHLGGEPLTLRHGAPLRLVCPRQYAYKSAKHLVAIEFVDELPDSAYGPKEHLRARVDREERHERLPNWLLRWPYRVAIPITARWADRALAERPDGVAVRTRAGR